MGKKKQEKKCVKCGVIIMYKTKLKTCHLCTTVTPDDIDIPRSVQKKLDKKDGKNEN